MPNRPFVDLSRFLLPLLQQQGIAPFEYEDEPRAVTPATPSAPAAAGLSSFLPLRTKPLIFPEELGGRQTFFGRHPRATGLLEAGLLGALQAGAHAGEYEHPLQPISQALLGAFQYPEMRRKRAVEEALLPYQLLGPVSEIQERQARTKYYGAQAERLGDVGELARLRAEATRPVLLGYDEIGRPITSEFDATTSKWITTVGGEKITTPLRGAAGKLGDFKWYLPRWALEHKVTEVTPTLELTAWRDFMRDTVGTKLQTQEPFQLSRESREEFRRFQRETTRRLFDELDPDKNPDATTERMLRARGRGDKKYGHKEAIAELSKERAELKKRISAYRKDPRYRRYELDLEDYLEEQGSKPTTPGTKSPLDRLIDDMNKGEAGKTALRLTQQQFAPAEPSPLEGAGGLLAPLGQALEDYLPGDVAAVRSATDFAANRLAPGVRDLYGWYTKPYRERLRTLQEFFFPKTRTQ